jgi:hypothetical protein
MKNVMELLLNLNQLNKTDLDATLKVYLNRKDDKDLAKDEFRNELYNAKGSIEKLISLYEFHHYYSLIQQRIPKELSREAAAEKLGVCLTTLNQYTQKKGLPFIKRSRKKVVFLDTDIELWQQSKMYN